MDQRSVLLQEEYNKRFEANAQYRNSVWKILCEDFFSRYIDKESILLDLGAGWGEFSRNISAKKKYAMDLNPDCGKRIKGYADFIQQDCSNTWPLPNDSLDVIFTSNFLEHLPNKTLIDLTLTEAFRCLKKNGILICVGPNIKYLPGVYWDYWDHYTPITDSSMSEALKMRQFLFFIVSGGIAAFLNWVSRFIFSIWMPFELAVMSAFFIGLISGYVLMKLFVFDKKQRPIVPEILKYVIINLFALTQTLLISVLLAKWVLPLWGISTYTEALAHLAGVLFPVVTSYFGHKFLTFR